ncbi:unnamed protein product, partial [marine sediment metagenome]
MLEFLGHKVIRQNHIGDWGTQFGMLCALYDKRLLELSAGVRAVPTSTVLGDLETFYKEASQLFDTDGQFANTARAAVAGLHSGSGVR